MGQEAAAGEAESSEREVVGCPPQALPAPQQPLAGLAATVPLELLMPWRTRDSIMSTKRAEQIEAEAGDSF